MPPKNEVAQLQEMINTMNEQLQNLNDMVDGTMTASYGLSIDRKDLIRKMTNREIESLNMIMLENRLSKEEIDKLKETQKYHDDFEGKDFIEYARHAFKEVKKSINEIIDLENERNEIVFKIEEMTNRFFEYRNSEEYKQKTLEKIEELKKQAEEEENPSKKREILKMLKGMEDSQTLNFLIERFDKFGAKEIDSVKSSFFTGARSSAVITKFKAKLPRYGYNPDVYKSFFNIEEKYLPTEYRDFNNLFLFNVMRFISYTDTNDKIDGMHVSAILIKLYNLVTDKFPTPESKDDFINIIKTVDEKFFDFRASFKERNITSPDNPIRRQKDDELDEKRRMMIIASLENEGIHPYTKLETTELREMLQQVIKFKETHANYTDTEDIYVDSKVKVRGVLDWYGADITHIPEDTVYIVKKIDEDHITIGNETSDLYEIHRKYLVVVKDEPETTEEVEDVTNEPIKTDASEIDDANSATDIPDECKDGVTDPLVTKHGFGGYTFDGTVNDAAVGLNFLGDVDYEKDLPESSNNGDCIVVRYTPDPENPENYLLADTLFVYTGSEWCKFEDSGEDVLEFTDDGGNTVSVPLEDVVDGVDVKVLSNEESEVNEPMVVKRVIKDDTPKQETKEIECYVDMYGCYYAKDGDTYSYFDQGHELIEKGISEEDILRLNSSANLTKTRMEIPM